MINIIKQDAARFKPSRTDSRVELEKIIKGFLSLICSSVFSAICFILLASNRFPILQPDTTVFLILFVQWQTLGLTIAKHGIEEVVFAAISKDESICFDGRKYIRLYSTPLAGLFSIIVSFIFSPWAAFIIFFSILFDAHSMIITADLNARKRYTVTSIANLFNHPLFFLLIVICECFRDLNTNVLLFLFLLTSFVRWLWLKFKESKEKNRKDLGAGLSFKIGAKAVLNYLLFRVDQVILGATLFNFNLRAGNHDFVGKYVYMAKFPELVSGVMVIAGWVLLPRVFIRYPFDMKSFINTFRRYLWGIAAFIIMIITVVNLYVRLWNGRPIEWYFVFPFVIHSVCVFIVNLVTYSMLRQGYLRGLIRNLCISVFGGAIIIIFSLHNKGAC